MFYLENILICLICCIIEMLVIFSNKTETRSLSNEHVRWSHLVTWPVAVLTKMKLVWLPSSPSVSYGSLLLISSLNVTHTPTKQNHLIWKGKCFTFLSEKSPLHSVSPQLCTAPVLHNNCVQSQQRCAATHCSLLSCCLLALSLSTKTTPHRTE